MEIITLRIIEITLAPFILIYKKVFLKFQNIRSIRMIIKKNIREINLKKI